MNNQKKIGAFIREARERQNITRETLARSLQISEAELSAWEEGVSYPALTQAPALARELSVSLDELFNARYHTAARDYQRRRPSSCGRNHSPPAQRTRMKRRKRPRCKFLWNPRPKASPGCRFGQRPSLPCA